MCHPAIKNVLNDQMISIKTIVWMSLFENYNFLTTKILWIQHKIDIIYIYILHQIYPNNIYFNFIIKNNFVFYTGVTLGC